MGRGVLLDIVGVARLGDVPEDVSAGAVGEDGPGIARGVQLRLH